MDKNIIENPEIVTDAGREVKSAIKSGIFDLIAIAISIAVFLLGLGAFDFAEITLDTLLDLLVSFGPFYIAMQILNRDYYLKGVFKGKVSNIYKQAMSAYSSMANSLTGEMEDTLDEFCEEFNANALKKVQSSMLKRAGLKYEQLYSGITDDKGAPIKPIISMSKHELKLTYTRYQRKWINKAIKAGVKGINANILLGDIKSEDATNIGKNEKELRETRLGISAIRTIISVGLLSCVVVNDIQTWSWVTAALILYKVIYTFVASYMQYFNAYNDITVDVVNHMARKSDILKQFKYWHDNKYHNTNETS